MSLAKNVAAFVIFADGIPVIYAGQEQHYSGGNDPANREATWLSGYSTTSPLYELIATSNALRTFAAKRDSGYVTYKVCACMN
jgi:alpha-amylase